MAWSSVTISTRGRPRGASFSYTSRARADARIDASLLLFEEGRVAAHTGGLGYVRGAGGGGGILRGRTVGGKLGLTECERADGGDFGAIFGFYPVLP